MNHLKITVRNFPTIFDQVRLVGCNKSLMFNKIIWLFNVLRDKFKEISNHLKVMLTVIDQ